MGVLLACMGVLLADMGAVVADVGLPAWHEEVIVAGLVVLVADMGGLSSWHCVSLIDHLKD